MRPQVLYLLSYLVLTSHASTVVKNATYDDLQAGLTDTPLGTYDGLTYNAIVLAGDSASLVAVGGVAFVSPPNRALTSEQQQLTNGTASFTVTSPYKSLNFLDFYFGCTVRTGEGAVAIASQCTITVAGFLSSNDQEVAIASYTFTPPESPVAPVPMMHAELPSTFSQPLFNVTISQTNPLLAVLLDNLHYSLST